MIKVLDKLKTINQYQKKLQELNIGVVYLFGSYSQNIATNLSDIDIGVVLNKPIRGFHQRSKIYFQMEEIIYSLLADFPNEIQIVILNSTPIVFQHQIIEEATVLFEQSIPARLTYEENILRRYLDFQPIYNDFLKTRLEARYV